MRYLVFHKPYGVMSQFTDEAGHPGLKRFIDVPGVYPVGRLDHDSEGLLLLTDDGQLAHQLADPKYEHPKTYWVQVENIPDDAALDKLRQGVMVQGAQTRPAEARRLPVEPDELPMDVYDREPPVRFRKSIPTAWIELVLREGRNRQVRRMTAAVGHPTLRLLRVAIGPIRLTGLPPGMYRDLSKEEVHMLRQMIGRTRREATKPVREGGPQGERKPFRGPKPQGGPGGGKPSRGPKKR